MKIWKLSKHGIWRKKMARKLKVKTLDKKDVKKEIQANPDVHLFLFSVYKASGHLIKKFKLFTQLGLNEHSLFPNSDLDISKVKIKGAVSKWLKF